MKALVVTPLKADSLQLEERPMPMPGPGQVRVRTLEMGFCGTDIDIIKGEYGEAPSGETELVLGHENLGVVDRLGVGVSEPAVGELVVASVRRPCPQLCLNCRAGEEDMCGTGHYLERGIKALDGYGSAYYLESPDFLVTVPASLREVAVLLEPLSIVEKGIRQAFQVQTRLKWAPRRALVTGAGPVGLLAAMVLRLRGLETTVLDIVEDDHPKAQRVRELGAQFLHGDAQRDLASQVCQDLGPQDLVIEATGMSAISFPAVLALAPNGVLVRLGLSTSRKETLLPADEINQDMVLDNIVAIGSVSANRVDYRQGVTDMQASLKAFPGWLPRLISRRIPLENFEAVLHREKTDIKVVLTL